jgi:hypothetical protein
MNSLTNERQQGPSAKITPHCLNRNNAISGATPYINGRTVNVWS